MIAKKVAKAPEVRDNFQALAAYVAGARDPGERLVDLWIVGCDAGSEASDLDAAIAEVEAVRSRKPAGANLTYHLIVSLRAGEVLDGAQLREAERAFAGALGFGEHRRVAAAHGDTDNFHMHVACNRMHPASGKVHSPWGDYRALERTCREPERRFGLSADLGMSEPVTPKTSSVSASTGASQRRTHPSEMAKPQTRHPIPIIHALCSGLALSGVRRRRTWPRTALSAALSCGDRT